MPRIPSSPLRAAAALLHNHRWCSPSSRVATVSTTRAAVGAAASSPGFLICSSTTAFPPRGLLLLQQLLRRASWLGLPSIPDVFRPFGVCFVYGLGGAGPGAQPLLRALFRHAHNLASRLRCRVVAAEVAACEPHRGAVPRWDRLTVDDLWCVKRILPTSDGDGDDDLIKAPPGPSIFVDPREV